MRTDQASSRPIQNKPMIRTESDWLRASHDLDLFLSLIVTSDWLNQREEDEDVLYYMYCCCRSAVD